MFYLEKYGKNVWAGQFSLLAEAGIKHGISTRFGGVSTGCYQSMNLALHVADSPEKVWQNRQIFCQALGMKAENLCTCQQVHKDNICCVTAEEAGAGRQEYAAAIADTDALITNVPGIPLMLFFADCTPLMLYDPVKKVIAVAHGGWKGTAAMIAAKTVAKMQEVYGTSPQDCLAAIGPAIGPCCYEVGENVQEIVRTVFPALSDKLLLVKGDKVHLDLWQANKLQLLAAGLQEEKIDCAETCTQCNADLFYSYRADNGQTGRIAAVMMI